MERFAIKIDNAVKLNLYNICRLCGIDNPSKIPIIDALTFIGISEVNEEEPDLSKKIFDCVGIKVKKNDQMPRNICTLCVDKINDFYEYREMCSATNIQTRKLLGITEVVQPTKKKRKLDKNIVDKVEIKSDDEGESILGILGEDDIDEKKDIIDNIPIKGNKGKHKKNWKDIPQTSKLPILLKSTIPLKPVVQSSKILKSAIPGRTGTTNRTVGRPKLLRNTVVEIPKLETEEIKDEENLPIASRIGRTIKFENSNTILKKKDKDIKLKQKVIIKTVKFKPETTPLLTLKTLNKRERKREIQNQKLEQRRAIEEQKRAIEDQKRVIEEQKRELEEQKRVAEEKKLEKKRKTNPAETIEIPSAKKVKREAITAKPIICSICIQECLTTDNYNDHLVQSHSPNVMDFGCSSCAECFKTLNEQKDHHMWHKLSNTSYICTICNFQFDKLPTYTRHISHCKPEGGNLVVRNIVCALCNAEFPTQNLHDWHNCYMKNHGKCQRCGRRFIKKTMLFKHAVRCTGVPLVIKPPAPVPVVPVVEIPKKKKKSKNQSNDSFESMVKSEPETILDADGNATITNEISIPESSPIVVAKKKQKSNKKLEKNENVPALNTIVKVEECIPIVNTTSKENALLEIPSPTLESVAGGSIEVRVKIKSESIDDSDDVILVEDEIVPPIVIVAEPSSPTKKKEKKSKHKHKKEKRTAIEKETEPIVIKQEPIDSVVSTDADTTEDSLTNLDSLIKVKSEPIDNVILLDTDDEETIPANIVTSPSKKKDKKSKHKHKKEKRALGEKEKLMPVVIKQEPLDAVSEVQKSVSATPLIVTSLAVATSVIHSPNISTISKNLSTPLSINIKKEPTHPGYDTFDPVLAQNIKQETADESSISPKQPSLRLKITKEHGTLNATIIPDAPSPILPETTVTPKKRSKPKNLYKKPALLAMKIRQEMMARLAKEKEEANLNSSTVATTTTVTIPVISQVSAGDGTQIAPDNIRIPVITNVVAGSSIPIMENQFSMVPIKVERDSPEHNYEDTVYQYDNTMELLDINLTHAVPQLTSKTDKTVLERPIVTNADPHSALTTIVTSFVTTIDTRSLNPIDTKQVNTVPQLTKNPDKMSATLESTTVTNAVIEPVMTSALTSCVPLIGNQHDSAKDTFNINLSSTLPQYASNIGEKIVALENTVVTNTVTDSVVISGLTESVSTMDTQYDNAMDKLDIKLLDTLQLVKNASVEETTLTSTASDPVLLTTITECMTTINTQYDSAMDKLHSKISSTESHIANNTDETSSASLHTSVACAVSVTAVLSTPTDSTTTITPQYDNSMDTLDTKLLCKMSKLTKNIDKTSAVLVKTTITSEEHEPVLLCTPTECVTNIDTQYVNAMDSFDTTLSNAVPQLAKNTDKMNATIEKTSETSSLSETIDTVTSNVSLSEESVSDNQITEDNSMKISANDKHILIENTLPTTSKSHITHVLMHFTDSSQPVHLSAENNQLPQKQSDLSSNKILNDISSEDENMTTLEYQILDNGNNNKENLKDSKDIENLNKSNSENMIIQSPQHMVPSENSMETANLEENVEEAEAKEVVRDQVDTFDKAIETKNTDQIMVDTVLDNLGNITKIVDSVESTNEICVSETPNETNESVEMATQLDELTTESDEIFAQSNQINIQSDKVISPSNEIFAQFDEMKIQLDEVITHSDEITNQVVIQSIEMNTQSKEMITQSNQMVTQPDELIIQNSVAENTKINKMTGNEMAQMNISASINQLIQTEMLSSVQRPSDLDDKNTTDMSEKDNTNIDKCSNAENIEQLDVIANQPEAIGFDTEIDEHFASIPIDQNLYIGCDDRENIVSKKLEEDIIKASTASTETNLVSETCTDVSEVVPSTSDEKCINLINQPYQPDVEMNENNEKLPPDVNPLTVENCDLEISAHKSSDDNTSSSSSDESDDSSSDSDEEEAEPKHVQINIAGKSNSTSDDESVNEENASNVPQTPMIESPLSETSDSCSSSEEESDEANKENENRIVDKSVDDIEQQLTKFSSNSPLSSSDTSSSSDEEECNNVPDITMTNKNEVKLNDAQEIISEIQHVLPNSMEIEADKLKFESSSMNDVISNVKIVDACFNENELLPNTSHHTNVQTELYSQVPSQIQTENNATDIYSQVSSQIQIEKYDPEIPSCRVENTEACFVDSSNIEENQNIATPDLHSMINGLEELLPDAIETYTNQPSQITDNIEISKSIESCADLLTNFPLDDFSDTEDPTGFIVDRTTVRHDMYPSETVEPCAESICNFTDYQNMDNVTTFSSPSSDSDIQVSHQQNPDIETENITNEKSNSNSTNINLNKTEDEGDFLEDISDDSLGGHMSTNLDSKNVDWELERKLLDEPGDDRSSIS